MAKRRLKRVWLESLLLGFIGAGIVTFFMVMFGMWLPNSDISLEPKYGVVEVTNYENLF